MLDRSPRYGPGDVAGDVVVPSSESQARFVQELHKTGAVLWEMDARTWEFTFVSPRAVSVFGYPLEEWKGGGFWQDRLVHPEDREWCVRFCSTATGQCQDHAFLYRAIRADGEIMWIRDVVRVITEDGKPVALRGLMAEVSDDMVDRDKPHGHAVPFGDPKIRDLRELLAKTG